MLRIDEVLGLEFESIDMLPPVCECVPASNAFSPTEKWKPGDRFDVRLKTRKQAQSGVGHSWTLHANDEMAKICPVCALI
jgi:hypothetical protein